MFKMKLVPIILVFTTISWCGATTFFCLNVNATSLQLICGQRSLENCVQDISTLNTSDVIRLKIEGCDQNVFGNASEKFPNIQQLDISHSGYRALNWTVNAFENVMELNTSFNELTTTPTAMLTKLGKLETLDLRYNRLKRILNGDFEKNYRLQEINLSNNNLEFIDANAFANLSVTDINLEGNALLSTFNCTWISTIRPAPLSWVYLSWQFITTFRGDQDCRQGNFVHIQTQHRDAIQITTAGYEINCSDQSFKNVQTFVAGSRSFTDVRPVLKLLGPSLKTLDLSGNSMVDSLHAATFERFPSLHELNLSDTGLKVFDFSVLNVNNQNYLKRLDISENHLNEVKSSMLLQYFEHLIDFRAAGNRIKNAHEIIRYLPASIQHLNLSGGNNLGNAYAFNTFGRLTAVEYLNFSDTNLSIFDSNPFKSLRHLVTLDVSNNDLKNVNFATLEILDRLKEFRASNCKLTNVSEIIQYLRPSVQILDVSGNLIESTINASSFHTLNNLNQLNLSGTHLQQFNLETINPLKWLHTLDISKNQLQTIDLNALQNFTRLERIYLNGNDLTELDSFALNASPNVSIAIGGNQFSCMYLKQLKRDSPMLRYIGDQLEQKHGENCRSSFQAIGDFLGGVYEKVKFW